MPKNHTTTGIRRDDFRRLKKLAKARKWSLVTTMAEAVTALENAMAPKTWTPATPNHEHRMEFESERSST